MAAPGLEEILAGETSASEESELFDRTLPNGFEDPRLDPNHKAHREYVQLCIDMELHFRESVSELWAKTLDWWDLFLAIQEDTRDPIDELWRSDVFVPLPFITTRTKAAQLTEILGNTEPVWQVEAARETGGWYEQAKHIERLLDFTHRSNLWRKFAYKLFTARSVQGTSLMKVVWTKRAHSASLFPTAGEDLRFRAAVEEAVSQGAPSPDVFPGGFDKWRELVNRTGRFGHVPAMPVSGRREIVEYEGPLFQYLPIWSMRIDPMIDEIRDQKFIIHRMYKPARYVIDRADDDPNSALPFVAANVAAAMHGWDGKVLEDEQETLASQMKISTDRQRHPYYKNAVILDEVWSPDEPFQYSIVMNQKAVINKRPFERPLLTSSPNLFALRNVVVPGHFFGLSDYQEPERLFKELNSFRRIRLDGATLTTLPVFVKQQGVEFAEALKKLKPGLIVTVPTKDAIQSLIRHTLPPEAYREPQEIKAEVEEATEVYSTTKGAPAQIGRVTGTEFQGRAGNTTLKFKVDASWIEDELGLLPATILSLFAQLGPDKMRKEIGGDPDALVDVTRDKLVEALGWRYRMRGATKNISPDLQVQQLQTAMRESKDVLTPIERRFALQLIMEMLDIRGFSKMLSVQGEQTMAMQSGAQMGAGMAQAGAAQVQGQMGQIVPPSAAPAPAPGGESGGPPAGA